MYSFIVKELSENYIDDVFNISSLSLKESWSKSAIDDEINNNLAKYFIATNQDIAVAFAGMWVIAGEANVTNIAVHPDFRGNGLGFLVTKSLLDYCRNNDISAITLEVRVSNTPAINLYKKLGFVDEGIRKKFYPDGEDALIMWNRNI